MANNDDQTIISLITPKSWFKKTPSAKQEKETTAVQPQTNFQLIPFVKKYWFYLLILTLLVFGVYLNSLGNGLVSDDKGFLLEGKRVGTWSFIFSDRSQLLRFLLYGFLYHLGGGSINATLFRLTNILFHLGNTYLIFILVYLLASKNLIKNSLFLAFFTSAIFAVHPLVLEAITWVSGGGYAQYAFFFLLSFYFYIKASQKEGKLSWGWKNNSSYYLSLLIFLLALFSTTRVAPLSFIFVVYEFCFGNLKKNWPRLVPFFLVSFLFGISSFLQIGSRQNSLQTQFYLEKGIDNPLIQIPFALANYFILFFWPQKLTFYHSDLVVTYTQLVIYWFMLLIYLGLLVYTFLKNKFLFFWLSFFLIGLAITLTPFRIAWIVAERYAYLSTIGVIVVVSYFLLKLINKKSTLWLGWGLFCLLVILLGIRTIVRNNDWKNEKSLFLSVERTTPQSPKAHNNLGVIYTDEKNYDLAEKELVTSIKLKPNYGDAYYNYGYLKQLQGKLADSEKLYKKALELNPNLYQAYRNLGAIYFMAGKTDLALENTQKALQIQPKDADLYTNLAIIYYKKGDKQKALEASVAALKVNPQDSKAQAIFKELQK